MKIAIDARLYGLKHAGIGRYVQNLLTELAELDTDNTYIVITSPDQKISHLPKHSQLIHSSVRHYTLGEQTHFLKILNSIDCDFVHFPHFNVPVLYRKPYLVTIHDLLWHEKIGFQATTLHPLIYLIKYAGYRFVINNAITTAKHIITPANTVKNAIINTFHQPQSKISVTYEAAAAHYHHSDKPNRHILSKYHLTQPYIIYTGSLYPHKNVDQVVLALKTLPQLQFVVVSARNVFSQKFSAFVNRHHQEHQVKVIGFVPDSDLKQLYYHATALIQPSLSEGFGLTGLEAMACGLPVICSNHPTLKEIYQNTALFVDTRTPQPITAAITKLMSQPKLAHRFSIQGKKQAGLYSWQKMATQTLQVYQQVYNSLRK